MKIPNFLKNKYILAIVVFGVYILFLDDYDIFSMIRYNGKLNELNHEVALKEKQIDSLNVIEEKLRTANGVERFAREKKFYKKDDEDIFVIFKD